MAVESGRLGSRPRLGLHVLYCFYSILPSVVTVPKSLGETGDRENGRWREGENRKKGSAEVPRTSSDPQEATGGWVR